MVLAKQNGQRHERHVRKATRLEDSDVGRGGSSGRRHRGSDGVRASMQRARETLVRCSLFVLVTMGRVTINSVAKFDFSEDSGRCVKKA